MIVGVSVGVYMGVSGVIVGVSGVIVGVYMGVPGVIVVCTWACLCDWCSCGSVVRALR